MLKHVRTLGYGKTKECYFVSVVYNCHKNNQERPTPKNGPPPAPHSTPRNTPQCLYLKFRTKPQDRVHKLCKKLKIKTPKNAAENRKKDQERSILVNNGPFSVPSPIPSYIPQYFNLKSPTQPANAVPKPRPKPQIKTPKNAAENQTKDQERTTPRNGPLPATLVTVTCYQKLLFG